MSALSSPAALEPSPVQCFSMVEDEIGVSFSTTSDAVLPRTKAGGREVDRNVQLPF